MGISEHAAYIKGAFDFSDIEKNSTEAKIISELLTLVADMADKINALEAENKELHEYVEELDHDLGALEEEIYLGDEDYDDYDDYDDLNDDEDFDPEDGEFYEIECTSCGEIVYFDESIDLGDLICPACGEKIDETELCDGNCEACDQDCE